jgi:outer membrane lipoprotein-sorting protein
MKMSLLSLLLVATLQSPADKAIESAVAAYTNIKTAKATFEQTITNPLLGSELKSRGEFEQSRPNRFAFRFTDPKGDVIVCDGKYVWVYLPTSAPGRVNRAACGAGSLDLIGEFFTNRGSVIPSAMAVPRPSATARAHRVADAEVEGRPVHPGEGVDRQQQRLARAVRGGRA